jgi:hypothetical protein
MESQTETTAPGKKEIYSTKWHIQLKEIKPESYAGIKKDDKLVFVFPDEDHIMQLKGDQGTKKTSTLHFIERILGGKRHINALNKEDKDIKGEISFVNTESNTKFIVRETKSTFTVKQEHGGVLSEVKKPFEFLEKAIGPVATSPMFLKESKGKDQITWLRGLYIISPEDLDTEKKLKDDYQAKFRSRTGVNGNVKRLEQEIEATGLYAWDKEQQYYMPTAAHAEVTKFIASNSINEEEIASQMAAINEKVKQYNAGKARLEQLELNRKSIEAELVELQKRIDQKNEELAKTNTDIETGNTYVKERETAVQEQEELQTKVLEAGEVKVRRERLQLAETKVKEYDTQLNTQIELNDQLDKLKAEQKTFVKKFTPPIEGFEVVVDEGEIDNPQEKREEGLYLNNRTMAELSESELWGLYMQLCQHQGIRIIMIENVTSLGTHAIEILNMFADAGGYVFCSAMERNETQLKATFHKQLK